MPATVVESVHRLIEQHGKGAVYAAVERLNQSIDEHDRPARDFWAQVVHAIHEFPAVGTGLEGSGCYRAERRPGGELLLSSALMRGSVSDFVLLSALQGPFQENGAPSMPYR